MRKILFFVLLVVASMSSAQTPDEILRLQRVVNDYFMQKYSDPAQPTNVKKIRPSNLWTRAVYYEGLMSLYAIDPQQRYIDYTDQWGRAHEWTAMRGVTTTNADNQCCQQTFLDRYEMTKAPEMIAKVKENLDYQMQTSRKDYWWWIDAIQMALPLYAKYAKATGERRYLNYGMELYRDTRDRRGLFNRREGLWWRDSVYKSPYAEPDGKPCYWSRGNGWVYAALVRTMATLSPKNKVYQELRKDFILMSRSLMKVQRADGFWNASLVSSNYAGPEMTGTALFLYGMSWGINHGILKPNTYRLACDKAWKALATCVHGTGFLGYNQGTGAGPSAGQPVTYTSIPDFEDYGTGCFLLGGSEYYKLKTKK